MSKHTIANSNIENLGVKSAAIAYFAFLGKLISLISGMLMLIVVARVIGPVQYGVYTVALAVAGLIGAFGSINIGSYFNKVIPKLLVKKQFAMIGILLGDGLSFVFILSAILALSGIIIANSVSVLVFGSGTYVTDVDIAMLSIIGIILYPILSQILVGIGTGNEVAVSSVAGLVFQAISSTTLVLLGFGAIGALIGYALGYFLAAIITLYMIHKHYNLKLMASGIRKRLSHILNFSVPITLSGISSTLTQNFSIVLLSLILVPTGIIGQYGVASRIGNVIDVVGGAIGVVLIPMFSSALQKRRSISKVGELYEGSLYYGFLFTAPIIVYASVLSKDIVVTIFTSAYKLTILYMPLIGVGILISLISGFALSLIISIGQVRWVLKYTVLTSIIQVVTMIILAYFLQVLGVLIAYFYIGNIVLGIFCITKLRSLGINLHAAPLIRVIIASVILSVIMLPLIFLTIRPLYVLLIGIVVALVAYPAVTVMTRAVSKNEMNALYKISKDIPLIGNVFGLLLDYGRIFLRE